MSRRQWSLKHVASALFAQVYGGSEDVPLIKSSALRQCLNGSNDRAKSNTQTTFPRQAIAGRKSLEPQNAEVNPRVEWAKSLFFGDEVGEGWQITGPVIA